MVHSSTSLNDLSVFFSYVLFEPNDAGGTAVLFFASEAAAVSSAIRAWADARLVWADISSVDYLKLSLKCRKLGLDGRKCPTVYTLSIPVGF